MYTIFFALHILSHVHLSYAQYLPYNNNDIQYTYVYTFGSTIQTSTKLIVNHTGVATSYPGTLVLPSVQFKASNSSQTYVSSGVLSRAYSTWGICQNRIYFNFVPSMCVTSHKVTHNCTDWTDLGWVDTSVSVNQFSDACTDWNTTLVDCKSYVFNDRTRINPLLSNYSMFYTNGKCILYGEPSTWEFAAIIAYSCIVAIAYLQFAFISATITSNVAKQSAYVVWQQFLHNAFLFNEIIALVVFLKASQLVFDSDTEKYLPVVEYIIGKSTADILYTLFIGYDVLLSVYVAIVLITQQKIPSRYKRITSFIKRNNTHKDATFIVFSMSVELILVYSLVQFSSVGLFSIGNVELMNVLIGFWILFQLGKYTILVWFTGNWFHVLASFTNTCVFFTYATFFLFMPLFVGPFSMSSSDPWVSVLIATGLTTMMVGSYSTLDQLNQNSYSCADILKQYQ